MNAPGNDPAESVAPDRPLRFDVVTRILHWAMAVLIVTMLFLGAMLVGSLGNYHRVLILHETTGIAVLILAVVRIGNRLRRPAPPMLPSISRPERMVAAVSEVLMYVLFVAQPVVGWALVSASGAPIRLLGGVHLPAITPHSAHLYHLLRDLHTLLAFGLLAVFTAHMCAVLAHTLLLRDQLLSRMTFTSIRRERG
ncbi:cytochrome b [Nocardia speluncae]|uniref:Cytochrome b n=1 Tax=Nocardia speluncae TaxID=419477 RepID=A0A846XFA3_9NOCA|nr:cytochrome b [Nocardia speluncae]NKY33386.1 cytochrome b [Nocardia speluncae]